MASTCSRCHQRSGVSVTGGRAGVIVMSPGWSAPEADVIAAPPAWPPPARRHRGAAGTAAAARPPAPRRLPARRPAPTAAPAPGDALRPLYLRRPDAAEPAAAKPVTPR